MDNHWQLKCELRESLHKIIRTNDLDKGIDWMNTLSPKEKLLVDEIIAESVSVVIFAYNFARKLKR